MDNIPLEVQLLINELVEFWQTNNEAQGLIDRIRSAPFQGCLNLTFFFLSVRNDLRKDKPSRYYAASSASEFKQLLEDEYRIRYQMFIDGKKVEAQAKVKAERQEREKTRIQEERQRRARAEFDALGRQMRQATSRADRVKLARKREELAQYTGDAYINDKWCWNCRHDISSAINAKCHCGWYICGYCDSCGPDCDKADFPVFHGQVDGPCLPDFPDE